MRVLVDLHCVLATHEGAKVNGQNNLNFQLAWEQTGVSHTCAPSFWFA